MLTLYYKPTCAFCARVLGEVEDMGVKLNLKDIVSDPVAAEELEEKGGKRQVPFLVDTDRNVFMYESGDIVDYLNEHYANSGEKNTSFNGLKIHKSGESCEVCE